MNTRAPGHQSARLQFRGVRKCVYRTGALVLWCAGALFFSGCMTLNPATGKEEFIIFTTPTEVMLGAETHAQLSQSLHFSKDKAAQARLEMIGQRVTQVADRQDYQYHFFLVDKDELNAFTVPGGYIYFYNGLYKKLKSDDEIAAVLAHETGHCSARHVVKRFQAAIGYDFIGSLVFGQMQDAFAVRVARMGSDAIMNVAMASYSRDDEYQADRLGVKYMYLAGYDPEGMVKTFEVLEEGAKGDDKGWILLRSHPKLGDRIEAVKKEIAEVKNRY